MRLIDTYLRVYLADYASNYNVTYLLFYFICTLHLPVNKFRNAHYAHDGVNKTKVSLQNCSNS